MPDVLLRVGSCAVTTLQEDLCEGDEVEVVGVLAGSPARSKYAIVRSRA